MDEGFVRLLQGGVRLFEIQKSLLLQRIDPPTNVLIYHRVTRIPSDPLKLAVSPERFREQMRFLKEHFPIRRFEDPWSPGPSFVVTFDDGYADNFREALPILEELGVPATFFVSTGTIGSEKEYFWDELERIILLPERLPDRFCLADPEQARSWQTSQPLQRQLFYREMQSLLKGLDASRREILLEQLRVWAGLEDVGRSTHRPMTLEELKRLASSPWVTIGAHTVTHTRLSNLSSEEQEMEILGSKRQLEAWLEREVSVFSYPFGDRADYNEHTLALCRRHFAKTASTLWRQAHSWNDSHQLPRLFVGDWPAAGLIRQCLR